VRLLTLHAGCHLPPGRFSRYSFLLEARAIVQLERLTQLKKSVASLGIKPATFQLVTWCLNQHQPCYRMPQRKHKHDSYLQFRCTCTGDSSVPDSLHLLLQNFGVLFCDFSKITKTLRYKACLLQENTFLNPNVRKLKHSQNNLACGLTLSRQMSIYNRNVYSSAMDRCRHMITSVPFTVLRSYFIHTLLVGTVCYTNIFMNVLSASSCHLEVTV
jgi:hypothetical protein